MDGLFSYMTEFERDLELLDMITESRLNHISLEIDKLLFEHAENISALELKVMMESGSVEDLEYLYVKEAEEVKEKSKGLIARLFDTIIGFIKKIKNALFGVKVDEDNLPDQVKLNKDPDVVIENGNKLTNALKNILNNHKAEIGAIVGATATAAIIINKDKIGEKINKLKSFITGQEKQLEGMQAKANSGNLSDKVIESLNKGMQSIRQNISDAKELLTTLLKAAAGNPDAKNELYDRKIANQEEREANKQAKKEAKQQKKDERQAKKEGKQNLKQQQLNSKRAAADKDILDKDSDLYGINQQIDRMKKDINSKPNTIVNGKSVSMAEAFNMWKTSKKKGGTYQFKPEDENAFSKFADLIARKTEAEKDLEKAKVHRKNYGYDNQKTLKTSKEETSDIENPFA